MLAILNQRANTEAYSLLHCGSHPSMLQNLMKNMVGVMIAPSACFLCIASLQCSFLGQRIPLSMCTVQTALTFTQHIQANFNSNKLCLDFCPLKTCACLRCNLVGMSIQ